MKRTLRFCCLVAAAWPAMTFAQAAATCSAAYESAQEERAAGHLRAALARLRVCVAQDCPKFIREDCARWIDQTESSIPTVVFAVRKDGKDQTEVQVSCDGALFAKSVDGKAIGLDPGSHEFSFKISGFDPIRKQLLAHEGERNRIIEVEFRTTDEKRAMAAPDTSAHPSNHPSGHPSGPIPSLGTERESARSGDEQAPSRLHYGLAGLGVLGLAGFGVLAVLGNDQQKDLERSCSPHCQPSQVDGLKTKYLMADGCMAVGILSLGAAVYFYLTDAPGTSPRLQRDTGSSLGFVPRSSGRGGVLQLSSRF